MFLQYQLVGRLGLIFSVCALLTACNDGQISESGGGPSDPRIGNDGSGNPSNPGVDGEDSPLVCAGASADVSASSGWRSSQASQPTSGELRFEFKARPTAEDLNGLVAVGAENIDEFTEATIAVRFAEDGFVDARDGAIYDSDVSYPYDPGVWYNVVVTADIDSKSYDVEIGSCGESPKMLIQDASFRDDASVSDQLSGWAVWSSQSAALDVSTPAWIASSVGCLPASCQTLGHVCGQPADGCGSVLSCGGCGNGLICSSGVCIDESTPPPPCQPATCQTLGAECGVQADGCGGSLNCGGCSSGQICSRGACVAEPAPPPPCEPATCQTLGAECGVQADGCGGSLNCGGCSSGQICSRGACVAEPAPPPPCEPATCQTLGAECGSQSDGCGGTLRCGTCEEPTTALEPLLPLTGEEPVTWETMYERCTGDDYPVGYRPPTFVRPTTSNTGANCSDKASGCPTATLTPLGTNNITTPGTYENFYVEGSLRIQADNVTIRNFEIRCTTNAHAIYLENSEQNITVEYGSVIPHPTTDQICARCVIAEDTTGKIEISHLWCDRTSDDFIQATSLDGPIFTERSLFTRGGDNGGYGSSGAHFDAHQYLDSQGPPGDACYFGNRLVPSYCPNFYQQDNLTQNYTSVDSSRFFIYNNWVDGSANNLVGAGNGHVLANNKFGNFTHEYLWNASSNYDNGGNVWECDGSPITEACLDVSACSPQSTCPWGFSNAAVNGWDGANWHTQPTLGTGPWDSNNDPITCSGTAATQEIDPTKNCTSDGSGCIYTHGGFTP